MYIHFTGANSTLISLTPSPVGAPTDVPDPIVVASQRGELALRLQFEAQHSNVLVVTAELLNGCLAHTVITTMSMELLPDQHPLMVS